MVEKGLNFMFLLVVARHLVLRSRKWSGNTVVMRVNEIRHKIAPLRRKLQK